MIPDSSSSYLGRGGASSTWRRAVTASPNGTEAGPLPMGSSQGYLEQRLIYITPVFLLKFITLKIPCT